jgi:hypothetical protein
MCNIQSLSVTVRSTKIQLTLTDLNVVGLRKKVAESIGIVVYKGLPLDAA